MLKSVSRWSYRHRWVVLAIWVLALVGSNVLAKTNGGEFNIKFQNPGSDSQAAQDLLVKKFPSQSGASGDIVFAVKDGTVKDPAVQQRMEAMFAQLLKDPSTHVSEVVSPYSPRGATQISPNGKIAFAQINFNQPFEKLTQASAEQVVKISNAAANENITVEQSGTMFQSRKPPGGTEMIGILAAIIILLIAFGSVLAMGLPIGTALFSIGIGLACVDLLANVMSMPDFATQLAAMIGIGVGIDYALFIVTRYRQSLQDGMEPEAATLRAINTSGKAVLFAGCTVVISLLGMFLMGLGFVNGLAVGAATAVVLTMLASITLLPALLGFTGRNIDKLSLQTLFRKLGIGRSNDADDVEHAHRETVWWRWSRFVQHHAIVTALASLVVLVALAIPLFSMRLGHSDASNLPTSDTTRRAYDLLAEGFGKGFNGPFFIAVEAPNASAAAKVPALQQAIAKTPGIVQVSPAIPNNIADPSKPADVYVIRAFPSSGPQDEATVKIIQTLRNDVIPKATAGTGLSAHVGGVTALFDDFADLLARRLPVFIGVVLALSFLLLLAVFRSVVVPLKAVIMNLLSIGAAYGLLVAVFQWGWGASLIGVGQTGPIESFVPMMMFAILFGLSMDYEVFLLSRIKEEYDISGDNATAVADGLSHTARVITAAAAIMVCVFGSFVFGDNSVIKMFGLGLAAAIFIDATLVRMVLVPSTMELLGNANWWFPRWLDRIVPKIHIEADPEDLNDYGTPHGGPATPDELVGAGKA